MQSRIRKCAGRRRQCHQSSVILPKFLDDRDRFP
jgi:hypothetical protein